MKWTFSSRLLVVVMLLSLAAGGCRATREPTAAAVEPFLPPTIGLEELVERTNANNARLESLWARGYMETVLREGYEVEPRAPLNGTVIIQHLKPDRVRLNADKDIVGGILDIGTDGENFWLWLPTEDVVYYGDFANLDPRRAAGLPLRPDLVLQVLGVNLLPTDLTQWPAPTLRYNPDAGVYMLAFVEPVRVGTPRLAVTREVWYSLPTDAEAVPLPRKVILNSEDGRPLLVANLSRHRPVGGNDGPLVATRFLLFFPETGSKMRIDLEEESLVFSRGRRGRELPSDRTFRFSPADVGAREIINLNQQQP